MRSLLLVVGLYDHTEMYSSVELCITGNLSLGSVGLHSSVQLCIAKGWFADGNCNFGTPLTLNEFLKPKEEAETRDSAVAAIFDGPEGDKAIIAKVVREVAEKNNKVIKVDTDDEDKPRKPDTSRSDMTNLAINSLRHVYNMETPLQTLHSTY